MNYSTPQYCQSYKKIYPFAEYGDYETFFIELVYYIYTDKFVSRLGETLHNKVAMNDELIFNLNDVIDFDKYKLLKEAKEVTDIPSVEMITETYGYAPNKVYQLYTSEIIDKYGFEDTAGYLKFYSNSCIYNAAENTFTHRATEEVVAQLSVGDMVRAEWQGSGTYYSGYSASVPILEKVSATQFKTVAFEVTFRTSNYTAPKADVANCITNHIYPNWNGWRGSTALVRDIAVTLPKAEMTTIHNQVSFYTEFPELEQKHKVFLGNAETDTITNGTNPTLEEWKQMKVNGDFINVQDATVDMVYPTTLYKKTLKQMKVR